MTTNRKLNEILIREDGFSKTEISVSEGETLVFYSNSKKKTENFSYENIGLVQVVPDDNGENFRPVVGGYIFEQLDAKITLKFKVIGEFLFKLKNHPSNPAPCKVKVVHEVPLNASIADDGFHPKIIKIDEGQSIKWSWSKLSVPITIFESSVCESHYELQKKTKDLVTPSSSNDYTRKFDLPGVYYFQSESKSGDKCDLCVVEVQSSYREHTVEIFDNKFSPARITIEEGDLIWFHWNKNKCLKKHCIYQIYPPTPDHPSDRAYIPVKNGFKWSTPTRNGMVCHKFEKCGVYYYGDISGNECASYIGIIAVKPKSENTTIPFVEETKKFEQSVLTVETGDLIWFKWNKTIPISIKLDEACLVNDKTRNKKSHNQTECQRYDSKVIQRCGVYAFKITYAGCYYFCINNETDKFSLTVIASPALKDHKITITDSEAKPNILNINPEDRVWFVWDDTKRSQNIRQVNHANKAIVDGFLSGSLMESPGTFVESFNNLGIFYYTSDNFKGIMGAIVVVPEPGIHVVLLNERGPQPDPIVIKQNDVVIWKFDSEQTNDVVLIKKESDLYSYSESSKEILPRKYLSHAFKESGVYHFVSPSFDMTVRAEFIEAARGLDNTILSTVVVDNIEEYTTVYVDKEGFHPDIINVEVGKSILFDWRESNESHNITHISLPNERNSYKAITGSKAFTSGSPVVNNSFLHLFEEEGQFCVTSDGSQKHYCIIKVLNSAQKALTPQLCNKEPFILFKYHKIYLDCQTPNVDIHYTTDGSAPSKLTAKYNRDTGVIMNEEGINIIRAIAYSEHYLTSDIFTSHRFYVVNDPEPEIEPYRNTEPVSQSSNLNLEWWKCIPKITINSLGVGLLEIFWDRILEHLIPYISHYQIFLNKVSYRKYIPANVNKVLIKGLTGGRNYDIIVMIYPKDRSLLPQQSNIVAYNSPKTTSLGGPIISLKANRQKDQITICWLSIDPEETFIKSYELLINGKKHDEVRSSPGRHKITIEGCKPDTKYSIILVAVPKDGSLPLISNELEVILPLNLNEISLPDSNLRNLEKDFYDEYIEITDLESISFDSKTEYTVYEKRKSTYKPYDKLSLNSFKVRNVRLMESVYPSPLFSEQIIPNDRYFINYMPDCVNNFEYLPQARKIEFKFKQKKGHHLVHESPREQVILVNRQNGIARKEIKNGIKLQGYSELVPVVKAAKREPIDFKKFTSYQFEQTKIPHRHVRTNSLPKIETERVQETKYAPYLSYDNYLIPNRDILKSDTVNNEDNVEDKDKIEKDTIVSLNEEKNLLTHESLIVKNYDLTAPEVIDEELLPVAKVSVSHVSTGRIAIDWYMTDLPPSYLELTHYVIILIGNEFSSSIKSDASYECLIEKDGQQVPGVQHSWITKYNSTAENRFIINGILDTGLYQIIVNAVYKLFGSNEIKEYIKSSKTIFYTPLGPPNPPKLRVNNVDIQTANIEWIPAPYPRPEYITGYRLMINSELNQTFDKNINEFLLTDMQPGRRYKIQIVSLTNSIVPESKPSNPVTCVCPRRPVPPLISQLPSIRPNSAVIGWKPTEPRSNDFSDQVTSYKVMVNNKYHGEISSSNVSSYSYTICDLVEGKFYDVEVHAFCGQALKHPVDEQTVSCMISSEPSNRLSVTPTAPPDAVELRLSSLSTEGIEVSWSFPQQYGDAVLSGFQIVRNGKCYGNIIPSDETSTKISDIELGDTLNLQMISLTNHPVGKYTSLQSHPNYSMDHPQREQLLNPSMTKTSVHSDYPACKIGPVLTVKYTNLVKPVVKIWTEKVTGFSAIVVFQTTKMNEHFVEPDYFLVSYWPGTKPSDKTLRTIKTDKDFVQLSNLKPTHLYTVQVESRKESKRLEFEDKRAKSRSEYKFLLYSKSNLLQFQTASPPDPPTNLTVITTTCHAIKVSWDPPVDHGSELIAIRIDCHSLDSKKTLHIFKELTPDKKSCILDNLSEKTRYKISVTAISEEYFINHKIKELKQLPKLILESMPWLPSTSIEAMTSGTEPASNLKCKLTHDSCLEATWKSARVFGTNKLVNQILCYQEISDDKMPNQIALPSNVKYFKIQNIKIGSKYKIWIESVVMIKLNIETDSNVEESYYKDLKDFRCTNVCSEALIFRIPAPCEPVLVNLTGYTSDSIEIYWAKPCLFSEHKDPDYAEQSIYLYRHLIGYRIEVNGIRQRSLTANENFCVLTKCKPQTTYNVVVVALTCLITSFERANQINEEEIDISEIDESFSEPLQITTFSDTNETYLISFKGKFEKIMETNEPNSIGRIRLDWDIPKITNIGQLNINWFSVEESLTKRKSFDPSLKHCFIPVTRMKCIYECNLEIIGKDTATLFTTEKLFLEIPGSPDAPFIWLLNKKDNMVIIHWSEPRVYLNNAVGGYQLFLNDTKIGAKIDKQVQIANLPLKMNRNYKINIQALSSIEDYSNSGLSNDLHVNTSLTRTKSKSFEAVSLSEKKIFTGSNHEIELRRYYESENNLEFFEAKSYVPVKISKMGADYVELDWSSYIRDTDSINEYKIQWHCLNTNQYNEHRCAPNVTSYRVKRLGSGLMYCFKVFAIKETNVVVKRSKNIIIQMNAAPDRPIIKLRACNFKYITIEWNTPVTYGESHIVAYKLYVNGKVEAVLSSEQTTFTWSRGSPCEDYVFQVQAMSSDESLSSPLSDALRVTWPGIKIPSLRSIENENEVLRITWDEPVISGSAKISYYRVIAENEHSGRVQIQGPFDESIRECEFTNLDIGRNKIHLEITAYGSVEPICSNPIYVDFGHRPEAPNLQVQVLGLLERRKLEKLTCNLVNKRDKLLRVITHGKDKINLPKLTANLRQIDEALNDCLKLLANYTGFLVANLSWSCYQPNPVVRLLGFRIFVNGQQYGSDLNSSARSVRIKLSLEKAIYSIYITAFTDRTKMESQNSNEVEILSENFFPFSFYCLDNAHLKKRSWPEKGCCAYQDTLPLEKDMISSSKEIIHLGKLREKVETFKCEVLDLRKNKKINLESKSKSGKPTVILFWTKWCLPSIKTLNFFVMYSKQNSSLAEFVACHCGNEDPKDLYELIRKAGYLDENIEFVNDVQYIGSSENTRKSSVDQYDIKGVPSIIILNKNGYMTWKGRYCSYNYKSFENFMNHTFSEINDLNCTNEACELCSRNTTIDPELVELRSEQKSLTQYLESYIKPTADVWYGLETQRRSVPRLPRITTRQLISVPTYASFRETRTGSERSIEAKKHLFSIYKVSSKVRANSSEAGHCYRKGSRKILI